METSRLKMARPNSIPSWLEKSVICQNKNRRVFYYQCIESTMLIARNMIKEQSAVVGDIVVAEMQSGGKGRRGRSWSSPNGGLWFSLLVKPALSNEQNPLMAIIAAIAIVESIREVTGLPAQIKWPNDVLINGRKTCGIALDLVFDQINEPWIVLGIGLNVNVEIDKLPKDVQGTATSLFNELHVQSDRAFLFDAIIEHLEHDLANLEKNLTDVLAKWKKYNVTLNNKVKVIPASGQCPYVGKAIDIDTSGALIVEDENKLLHRVLAADVSIRFDNS